VTTYRPLVAVVGYHLSDTRVSRWPRGGYGVPLPYIECLRNAGARTAILSPGEPSKPEELLEPFDGLVLVGGGDVDPARYGATGNEHAYGVEPDRDALEIALLLAADRLGVPTLAICRGMQVMNVAFGGTLHGHLPDIDGLLEHGVPVEDTRTIHPVEVVRGSRLQATIGEALLSCSSHHHQGIDRVGEGLRVSGRSPDQLVEAIERDSPDADWSRWMVGVEWHPEDTAADDRAQRALFEGFVLMARIRGSTAIPDVREGRSRDYAIEDHDLAWSGLFEEEAARIRETLGSLALRVDHVGSTAVHGLAAKPVVDIQISVASLVPRTPLVGPLESLGYTFQADPTTAEHEYLKKDVNGVRRFQLHLCEAGGDWERRHLAFRDWLRDHPDDAAAYEDLKRRLATEHPRDLITYTEAKTAFIESIVERALASIAGSPPG
jgi:putative glutamine amidotransferase